MQWPRESSLGALFLITCSPAEVALGEDGGRENFPNQLVSPRNLLQWLRRTERRRRRERETPVWESREQLFKTIRAAISRNREGHGKLNRWLSHKKNGNQGMGILKLPTHHFRMLQSTKSCKVYQKIEETKGEDCKLISTILWRTVDVRQLKCMETWKLPQWGC